MSNSTYKLYLDTVRNHLTAVGIRLLTEEEECQIIDHLEEISRTYDPDNYSGLLLGQVLQIETARKTTEVHPDVPTVKQEQVDRDVAVLPLESFRE